MSEIERVVAGHEYSEIVAMTMMLCSMPRLESQAETLAVLPGMGEDWRLINAVDTWNRSQAARHLLIAGIYEGEQSRVVPTLDNLSAPPFNLARTEGVHIQPDARNTKVQADWLTQQTEDLNCRSLALFVSPYHLLRAYLTVLASFREKGVQIPILPVPVAVSPDAVIPETGTDAWTMTHGEVERILAYQQKGDVASYGELRDYLTWLWKQPLLLGSSAS